MTILLLVSLGWMSCSGGLLTGSTRVEPRRRARAYVRGLLAPLAGKNGWTLAEAADEATPDGMQRLLNAATWDADGSGMTFAPTR